MGKTNGTKFCNKACRTRRKIRRKAYCKTLKSSPFFNKIKTQWKKKTNNGYVKMDLGKKYTCDYYLREKKGEDYWNHVHLIRTVKYPKKFAPLRSSGYVFKKRANGRTMHTKIHLIDDRDDPRDIVDDMLSKYNKFVGDK